LFYAIGLNYRLGQSPGSAGEKIQERTTKICLFLPKVKPLRDEKPENFSVLSNY
jgi:hypothetical protein